MRVLMYFHTQYTKLTHFGNSYLSIRMSNFHKQVAAYESKYKSYRANPIFNEISIMWLFIYMKLKQKLQNISFTTNNQTCKESYE